MCYQVRLAALVLPLQMNAFYLSCASLKRVNFWKNGCQRSLSTAFWGPLWTNSGRCKESNRPSSEQHFLRPFIDQL